MRVPSGQPPTFLGKERSRLSGRSPYDATLAHRFLQLVPRGLRRFFPGPTNAPSPSYPIAARLATRPTPERCPRLRLSIVFHNLQRSIGCYVGILQTDTQEKKGRRSMRVKTPSMALGTKKHAIFTVSCTRYIFCYSEQRYSYTVNNNTTVIVLKENNATRITLQFSTLV